MKTGTTSGPRRARKRAAVIVTCFSFLTPAARSPHLGQNEIIPQRRVIGIFDLDKCSYEKRTRDYLAAAEFSLQPPALRPLPQGGGAQGAQIYNLLVIRVVADGNQL